MFRLKTLFKYLMAELTPPFLIGIGIFLFILMTTQLIKISELIIVHGVSLSEACQLIFYLLATFVSVSIPLAFVFSILLVLGRLSADREIIAMRAAGISQLQILPPFIFMSFLLIGVVLVLSFFVEPWGFLKFRFLAKQIGSDISSVMIQPHVFNERFFDLMIYADNIEPKTKQLKGIFLNDQRVPNEPLTVFASTGAIVPDPEGQVLTLRLKNGSIHRDPRSNKEGYQRIDFRNYDINIDIETILKLPNMKPRMMPYKDLREKLKTLDPKTKDYRRYAVEWHRKFALGASCLVFALFGVALGAQTRRTIRSTAFLVTLGLMLFYWVAYLKMGSIAREGTMPVWFAMWSPNLFIFIVGALLLWRNYRR